LTFNFDVPPPASVLLTLLINHAYSRSCENLMSFLTVYGYAMSNVSASKSHKNIESF
jgi:hypothetical protein